VNLKSGCIFWTDIAGPQREYPALAEDRECDVAIIGGGITGALAAHYLVEAGVKVVMLDRREIGRGSTSASTGLLLYELDLPLVKLADRVGWANAERAYQLCESALWEFQVLVQGLDDHCELTRRPSVYLATRADQAPMLHDEWAARRRCGIAVDFLNEHDVAARFAFRRPAALWSSFAMEVDPYRLTRALIRDAVKRGLTAHGKTEIVQYDAEDAHVDLVTAEGKRIRARHVVFATGYETPQFLKMNVAIKSTFAVATAPLTSTRGWPDSCLIWEASDPYLYIRSTRGGRAIIGGEDVDYTDAATQEALLPEKTETLLRKFRAMFPTIEAEAECAWAGTFAQTPDSLPYIGRNAAFPRGYFALGYGGNGITFSLIAAKIIRDLIVNGKSLEERIFRFGR
jgi:glycine/D-amino acid oxidase-like deaminating enzyme